MPRNRRRPCPRRFFVVVFELTTDSESPPSPMPVMVRCGRATPACSERLRVRWAQVLRCCRYCCLLAESIGERSPAAIPMKGSWTASGVAAEPGASDVAAGMGVDALHA